MCCILAYSGHDLTIDQFKEYLMRTVSRGPDMQTAVEESFGMMGFGRLAIMGLTEEGMQPFYRGKDCVVCNGELYGFKKRCDLRRVEPVQLKVENGFSYLVAFILNEKYDKPAFFRLDRIHSFKIMDIKIQEDVFLKYSEQNKKYDLFNMIAGDEQEIVLSVSARMRRVICDVFPKCVFVEECNSKYVYKIKTYKQGFMQWLMGQEEVEVLEPKDVRKEICKKYEENLRRYQRGVI